MKGNLAPMSNSEGVPRRLGLIVNPLAGLGGRVGLKGSDGIAIQRKALQLGAVSPSPHRAAEALQAVRSSISALEIITYPGEMGEDVVRGCGFTPVVIGAIKEGKTTSKDTRNAARRMRTMGVDLLLFAGGDGTARDIVDTVGDTMFVLGIPSGVKIHSAGFAVSPACAGGVAARYLQGQVTGYREAEVMDVDEDLLREGILSPRLYGYLKTPFEEGFIQGAKTRSSGNKVAAENIAGAIIGHMQKTCLYIIGPGTTTRTITSRLGLPKTLLGVDVVSRGKCIGADVNEARLLNIIDGEDRMAKIIIAPIGGQGYLFGRGNQQISPRVIRKVGRDNVIVVATAEKINSLRGRPFLVDTGERAVDRILSGYMRVVSGYDEEIMYSVADTTR